MAEIYVPINYSNVTDIIPLGEDIIYSTLCKAFYTGDNPWTSYWTTHLLVTEKGIAFSIPGKKRKDPLQLIYDNFTCISLVLSDGFSVDNSKKYFAMRPLSISIKSDPRFESKEKFLKRKSEFLKKFFPIVLEAKKDLIQTLGGPLDTKERKKQEKQVGRMEKYFNKVHKG